MTESIKELIEKINQEGIQAAQEKARQIQEEAQKKAEEILVKARSEAEKIISGARKSAQEITEQQKVLMRQAGRDFLLVLRQEINAMLERLILAEVKESLTSESLFRILSMLIKHKSTAEEEIIVFLNPEDLAHLQAGFLKKLKEEVKREIILRPSGEIRAGFVISYDAGKSQFDFSDKALAEYIATFLKPKLKEIFKD